MMRNLEVLIFSEKYNKIKNARFEIVWFKFYLKSDLLSNVDKNESHCSNMCITNVKQSIKIDF